jgi:hypothetical protein
MIYYFLPGTGIYGGIKTGYQWVSLLNSLGVPAVVASPRGDAAAWFRSSVSVLSQETALSRMTPEDDAVFSLPHDYPRLRATVPGQLVFHCQGTDPLIDPILADETVPVLTCWPQAHAYVRQRRKRPPLDAGISISDCFFFPGTEKKPNRVSFMPRRGRDLAEQAQKANPHLEFVPIDGMNEQETARILHSSNYFLATSENEWFGLPALEAMAAGCIVLSVPVLGGMDYLSHLENAYVFSGTEIPSSLQKISTGTTAGFLHAMRARALATAYRYTQTAHRRHLAQWIVSGREKRFLFEEKLLHSPSSQ